MSRSKKDILHTIIWSPKSKGVIISLILSLSLWFYANLNMDFTTYLSIPLEVKLPDNRALEGNLLSEVNVQVRGNGWQLINLHYFNSSARCYLDLSRSAIADSMIEITRNDLIKSVQSVNNASVIEIDPQGLDLRTGRVVNYPIALQSRVKVIPREGFCLIGDEQLKPDVINIRGNEKSLKTIKKWYTKEQIFDDVFADFDQAIPLSDSMHNSLRLSQKYVRLIAEIQQEASVTFEDIEIEVKGGISQNHILRPTFVRVIVSGGIEVLSKINPSQISVSINAEDIDEDSTGIIIPEVEVPEGIKLLRVEPRYVHHVKRMKN